MPGFTFLHFALSQALSLDKLGIPIIVLLSEGYPSAESTLSPVEALRIFDFFYTFSKSSKVDACPRGSSLHAELLAGREQVKCFAEPFLLCLFPLGRLDPPDVSPLVGRSQLLEILPRGGNTPELLLDVAWQF